MNVLWIFLGVAISIGITFTMSIFLGENVFPYNIIVIVALFIVISFVYQRRMLRKMEKGNGFNSLTGSGNNNFERIYTCSRCGTEYKNLKECPKCGFKGGRVRFG